MREEIRKRVEMIHKGIVPEGYTKTKVGITPMDWEVEAIKNISDIINGGTPATNNPEYWGDEFLWCTPTDITNCKTKYLSITERCISKKGLKNSSATLVPKGTLLLCSRATIGEVRIASNEISTNQGFKSLVCKNGCYNEFLYYLISSSHIKRQLKQKAIGTTFSEISKKDISKFLVVYPSLQDQINIAKILSTADKAIETTETLITLKQQKKKWLMQNLLTGKVRLPEYDNCPVPVQERIRMINDGMVPEGYKETKVGIIPREWNLKKINSLPIFISDGNYGEMYPKQAEMVDYGVPFLRANNISNGKIINTDLKYITEHKHGKLLSGHLKENDVLITTRGEIGKIAFVDSKFENANINAQICLLRVEDNSKLKELFLLYSLISKDSANQIISLQTGTALKQLPKSKLNKIELKIPPLHEQKAIANVLSTADKEIDLLSQKLDTFKQKKKALMQLLLTGIVRTTGLNFSTDIKEEGVAYVQ